MVDPQLHEMTRFFFEKHFPGFDFVIKSRDKKLLGFTDAEREQYFEDASRMVSSPIWKAEMEEAYKALVTHLALKSGGELEQTAYRVALMGLKLLQDNMIGLARHAESPVDNSKPILNLDTDEDESLQ